MTSYRSLGPLFGVLLAISLVGCSALPTGGPPTLTVDNRDDVQYRLTIYTVPNANTPNEIPFRATTAGGERRYTSPADLQSGASYYDVTVIADGGQSRNLTLGPATTVSTTVDVWEPGDATAYVIETTDDSASLVALEVITCKRIGQDHSITLQNGHKYRTSATCS